jgi:hypothetical protein
MYDMRASDRELLAALEVVGNAEHRRAADCSDGVAHEAIVDQVAGGLRRVEPGEEAVVAFDQGVFRRLTSSSV